MPKAKKFYKDQDKYRKIRNKERKKYYGKTAKYVRRPWKPDEDKKVVEHKMTDTELSDKIQRSVQSIQTRRWRLKLIMEGEK